MPNLIDKMFLTQEQIEAVTVQPKGTLILRGDSRTGKSTVLLARAAKLSLNSRVCVLVPNRNTKDFFVDGLNSVAKEGNAFKSNITVSTLYELMKSSTLFDASPSALLADALLNVLSGLAKTQGILISGSPTDLVSSITEAFKGNFTALSNVLSCSIDEAIHFIERFKRYLLEQSLLPFPLLESMLQWSIETNSLKKWDHLLVDDTLDFSSDALALLSMIASKSVTICTDNILQNTVFSLKPIRELSLNKQFVGKVAEVNISKNKQETFTAITAVGVFGSIASQIAGAIGPSAIVSGVTGLGTVLSGLVSLGPIGLTGAAAVLAAKALRKNNKTDYGTSGFDRRDTISAEYEKKTLGILAMTKAYCSEVEFKFNALIETSFGLTPEQMDVNVMTLHSSKGMDFDYVILVLHTEPREEQQAKALLHVGITRARMNGSTIIICEGDAGKKWLPYIENAGVTVEHVNE